MSTGDPPGGSFESNTMGRSSQHLAPSIVHIFDNSMSNPGSSTTYTNPYRIEGGQDGVNEQNSRVEGVQSSYSYNVGGQDAPYLGLPTSPRSEFQNTFGADAQASPPITSQSLLNTGTQPAPSLGVQSISNFGSNPSPRSSLVQNPPQMGALPPPTSGTQELPSSSYQSAPAMPAQTIVHVPRSHTPEIPAQGVPMEATQGVSQGVPPDASSEPPYMQSVDMSSQAAFGGPPMKETRTASPVSLPHQSSDADAESMNTEVEQTVAPYGWMSSVDDYNPDDDLHDPTKPMRGSFEPMRAVLNVGTLILLVLCLLMLFAGYPILHNYTEGHNDDRIAEFKKKFNNDHVSMPSDFPVARTNSSKLNKSFDQSKKMFIDPDTPPEAYEMESTYSPNKGKKFHLVFSDEFNTDGRSFYPGMDPFWEAVDLHYWATNNFEWYDPAAVYTKDGSLRVRLDQHEEHNLWFRGGMIQSWNKFCFRNGILIARIQLPGYKDVAGLWPAFWIMGNLGRAGYGATLQGTWPYSYDQCDVGTVMNQTIFNSTYENGWPEQNTRLGGATVFNMQHNTTSISFLPGQKLSRCTCAGEDHPGPFDKEKGEFTGRAAPEIDVFEAQVQKQNGAGRMFVSQSCQMAPYNYQYDIMYPNKSGPAFQSFSNEFHLNSYNGEITQQSLSGVSIASQQALQHEADTYDTSNENAFATYSLEYKGGSQGYVSWTSAGQKAWELYPDALAPDDRSHIGWRQYPKEPMYILLNLGISRNFGQVDWKDLVDGFPFEMSVDWVRVYQDPDDPESDIGCDPPDMPTADYIKRHWEAYTNSNFTVWGGERDKGGYGAKWPLNRWYSKGCKGTPSTDPGDPDQPSHTASFVPSNSVTAVQGAQTSYA